MDSIGVGVIGAGGFAHFAIQQFSQVPGFRFAGAYDANRPAAVSMTDRFGGIVADGQDALIAHPDTDLVYLGTPPSGAACWSSRT